MRRTWPLLLVPVKCIAADIRGVRVSGNERGGGVVRWWGGKWLGRGADKRTGSEPMFRQGRLGAGKTLGGGRGSPDGAVGPAANAPNTLLV